jgi:hypothetical protein
MNGRPDGSERKPAKKGKGERWNDFRVIKRQEAVRRQEEGWKNQLDFDVKVGTSMTADCAIFAPFLYDYCYFGIFVSAHFVSVVRNKGRTTSQTEPRRRNSISKP